ncbi:MAG: endonuclease/exonuclease/phosphatase family protein [Bacteroidales bacterium]|nr:endonuclease/exonuclease/phosphatase family protein [Bacteroidales bacterium]
MKRIAIIFALLLLCSCSMPADELKIISFNIRYNSYENIDGENGWPNRKEAVVRMIREERPAAIGLQEALIDQLLYLDSCLPEYRRIGVGRDDGEEGGEFMAIYYDTSRLSARLDLSTTLWLSETPWEPSKGWDAACYRTVTCVFFTDKKSGQSFCYHNTHLDHMGPVARAESAKYLAELTDESEGFPVVLGGDMNSTIDDTIFNAFYNVGLKPARELTDSTSNAITYNGYGKEEGKVIDHFFVKDLRVVSFRTLNGDYGVPYISDHYPIEIVIEL